MNIQKLLTPTLALLLAVGCAAKAPAPEGSAIPAFPQEVPPALTVISGDRQITATPSAYSWDYPNADGTRVGVEACGAHPLDMLDDLTPLALDGPTLVLRFDAGELELRSLSIRGWDTALAQDPESSYEANYFLPEQEMKGSEVAVTLPNGEGGIFEVHARFDGESFGDCYYAFYARGVETPRQPGGVAFSTQVVRVAWRESFQEEGLHLIRSAAELEDTLSAETPYDIAFDGLRAAYGPAFFAEKELLLVRAQAGSGSVRFWVDQVLQDDAGITVRIGGDMPEVGTADMGAWLLLIEIPAGTVQPEDSMRLVFLDLVSR